MQKPKVFWAIKPNEYIGNSYGYSFHNRKMFEHTAPFIEMSDDGKIALQITSADKFIPLEGKINVLFSMWEFTDLPTSYIKQINRADYLIVPSAFVRDLFRKYTEKPIYVCREGIEPKDYPFFERKITGRFRMLWCGASNPRKGYYSILQVVKLCDKFPKLEMYIKTTMPKLDLLGVLKQTWKHKWNIMFDRTEDGKKKLSSLRSMWSRLPRKSLADKVTIMGKNKNVIFDTRNLPQSELLKLYHSANCFLLPSWGEGWGLTLCEAMATGCPSVAVNATGCADFFDEEVGFPVRYNLTDITLENYENLKTKAFIPDTQDFIDKIISVMENYDKAIKKGKKAHERLHNKFTWALAGQRLGNIFREIGEKEKCL